MKWGFGKKAKKRKKTLPTNQLDRLRQSGQFYGVKLDRIGCKACSRLAGQVFSFKDAPRLPVPGCDVPMCTCQYLGVPERRRIRDRRYGIDRRNSIRLQSDRRFGKNRRNKIDKWEGYDQ